MQKVLFHTEEKEENTEDTEIVINSSVSSVKPLLPLCEIITPRPKIEYPKPQ